jgi:transcriptional regulator with XRE-family HTH domain
MVKTFGDLVRFKREQKGFSLNGLAKEAGLDVAYISKIEKNLTKQPSYLSVSKVAKALEITNEELATVFNVEVTKSESYKINDKDIEMKSVLSSMNDTIIKKIDLLTEDSLSATIEVLEKLKDVTKISKYKRNYIIMLGTLNKIDMVIVSHVYDSKVKDFIENVYSKSVVVEVEGSVLNGVEEILTDIFDVIELARENEYYDEEEIVKFERHVK